MVIGALAWWGLCFIPAVATFDDNSHQQIIEWATPSEETPDTEEPGTEPGTDDNQGSGTIEDEGNVDNDGDITIGGDATIGV